MIRLLKLSIPFFAAILISSFACALIHTPTADRVHAKTDIGVSPFAGMTVKEFLALTPKKYKQLTGEKLSFFQKLSLKHAQYRVKKMFKKNKDLGVTLIPQDVETNDFDIFGFILGIALGPVGILIAYLIEGKSSSTFKWSVIGALIWLGIFLLVVVVL
jgi:hypothetical protein